MPLFKCPRCEDHSYEVFRSHNYCSSCNYSPDFDSCRKDPARTNLLQFYKRNLSHNNGGGRGYETFKDLA